MRETQDAEIIISQNILGQVKVELQMDDLCWSKLKKSKAWKEVRQFLGVCQKTDSHQFQKKKLASKEKKTPKKPVSVLVNLMIDGKVIGCQEIRV